MRRALLILLLTACGGPCTEFAADALSYGRCEFADTQCTERCASRGVASFTCAPATGAQTSITCTCVCKPPYTVAPGAP